MTASVDHQNVQAVLVTEKIWGPWYPAQGRSAALRKEEDYKLTATLITGSCIRLNSGKDYKNTRRENKKLSSKIQQLKAELMQSVGVDLDSSLNTDVHMILAESENNIPHPPNSFARIFWDQQIESMRKHPNQMRWHPIMIKWCLHLRMLSSSCYNSFRISRENFTGLHQHYWGKVWVPKRCRWTTD